MTNQPTLPPSRLALAGTLGYFGVGALLLFAATRWAIPHLGSHYGIEPVLAWFVAAGLGVFLPLLLIACAMLRREGVSMKHGAWKQRLRLRPLTRTDILPTIAALAGIGILGGLSYGAAKLVFGTVPFHPEFMTIAPLTSGRFWILAAWLPFWVLNILGEELLWRGVLLPRQELAFGRWAWLANASGWLIFHLPFGVSMLLILWPILLILPYVVQLRSNTSVGIILHAAVNGPGFVAVAFGLV